MIFHNCIECDHLTMIELQLGAMQKIECEECNTVQWLRHSNIAPETYPESMIEVDEDNKSVKILTI